MTVTSADEKRVCPVRVSRTSVSVGTSGCVGDGVGVDSMVFSVWDGLSGKAVHRKLRFGAILFRSSVR
ncbi:MAG: hypothetical protein K1X53_18075 [Candidatus Sumerlaeaceae bacterium]|nr:hypothetical protein [Candidatus Sumerlaeaceae bacterium]